MRIILQGDTMCGTSVMCFCWDWDIHKEKNRIFHKNRQQSILSFILIAIQWTYH